MAKKLAIGACRTLRNGVRLCRTRKGMRFRGLARKTRRRRRRR